MTAFTASFQLNARQTTRQTLSPQMQKTLHLLQMSRDELEREIETLCERNPLLESRPAWTRRSAPAALSTDWAERAVMPESLHDHLMSQLALSRTDDTVRTLAQALIRSLDHAGRLDRDDWAALSTRTGAADALTLVQSFEPAGIAARSLQECFALQLGEAARVPDGDWAALLHNLPSLPQLPAPAFARQCGIPEVRMRGMLDKLRKLDPHPGHRFATGERVEITPDLIAARTRLGDWSIRLAWDPSRLLRTAPDYRDWQSDKRLKTEAGNFLKPHQAEAEWLARSLRQRGQTLLRVAQYAVSRQDAFMTDGPEKLSPLTMRDAAGELDLHESTVSRAAAHKYILTPRGPIALRAFFSTPVSETVSADETASSAAVRARIARMIDTERYPGRLSDARIVQQLDAEGIVIARRSVTKHRKALGIGSSRERARLASYGIAAE